jgi:hypothetical protein
MDPSPDSDDLGPIRTFVADLVEYRRIPHPWDDAAVGGGVNT